MMARVCVVLSLRPSFTSSPVPFSFITSPCLPRDAARCDPLIVQFTLHPVQRPRLVVPVEH
jgi:hypothetical protein